MSILAARKGLLSIGAKDDEATVFLDLMDSKSLFLTANADTVYIMGGLDLTKGPMAFQSHRAGRGIRRLCPKTDRAILREWLKLA